MKERIREIGQYLFIKLAVSIGIAAWFYLTLAVLPGFIIDETSYEQRVAWVLAVVLIPLWALIGYALWSWWQLGFRWVSLRELEAETERLIARGRELANETEKLSRE